MDAPRRVRAGIVAGPIDLALNQTREAGLGEALGADKPGPSLALFAPSPTLPSKRRPCQSASMRAPMASNQTPRPRAWLGLTLLAPLVACKADPQPPSSPPSVQASPRASAKIAKNTPAKPADAAKKKTDPPKTKVTPAVSAALTAASAPARAGTIAGLEYIERVFHGAPKTGAPGQKQAAKKSASDLPVLVMIHGLGDRPEAFLHLGDALKTPHRALALRGISDYSGSFGQGHAWFSTRVRDGKIKALSKEIDHAASRVAKGLKALNQEEKQPKRRFIVTGFSQGGILSYALAVQYPELVATALPIAGLLPPPSRKTESTAQQGRSTKIIAFHGEADRIVPYARAQALGAWLETQRFDYQMKSYPQVGHRIPAPMAQPLLETLEQTLQAKDQ